MIVVSMITFEAVVWNDYDQTESGRYLDSASIFLFLPDLLLIYWMAEAFYRLRGNTDGDYTISNSQILIQSTAYLVTTLTDLFSFCYTFKVTKSKELFWF